MRSLLTAIVLLCAASVGGQSALKAVPQVPGAFEPDGRPAAAMVRGKPLDAAHVESLAGNPDGYDVLVEGVSLCGMDCAHRVGRREVLARFRGTHGGYQHAVICLPSY